MRLGRERVQGGVEATLRSVGITLENWAAPGEMYEQQRQSRRDGPTDGQTERCLGSGQKEEKE